MVGVRISLIAVLAAVFFAAVILLATAGVYTDWLWFQEVGFASVFMKILTTRLTTGITGGLVFGGFLLLNLLLARSARPALRVAGAGDTIESNVQPPPRLGLLSLGASAIVAWVSGFSISQQWLTIERFRNQTAFGTADPIYAKDVGFYVFQLPLFSLIYEYVFSLLVVTIGGVALVYLFSGALVTFSGRLSFHPRAKAHLSGLLGLLLLVRAIGYRLEVWRLVYSPRGVAFGASYTDIHAELPALNILTALAVLAALVTVFTAGRRTTRPVIIVVAGLLVTSLALRQGYTTLVQQASVGPDEIAKERPYIEHNIRMTRAAFGLNNLIERDYPATENLTQQDLAKNQATVGNIRLWDWRPLRQTYSQLQEIRLYYTFNDVDLDRYNMGGSNRQVTLSVREMNQANLPVTAKTWVNQHLKFTHGYGLVVSPANSIDPQGLPIFYLQDIPPKGTAGFSVTRPEIYFGELTREYIIVDTKEKEFDYPLGDENAQTTYQGAAGISIRSLGRRLAFALRFRDYEIALANAITSKSRLIFNREIKGRVASIAPFLMYDSDPYAVIHDGRVIWMIDAYTVTRGYPYSEPSQRGYNYIRNSVKATVDSYDGTVRFYLFDDKDPLVSTYAKIFPGLFRPFAEMPEGLKQHIRYPADLFDVQSEMYLTYHMQDPTVFYNKEDQWSLPQRRQTGDTPAESTESYYMVMQLPGEKQAEYVMLMPFTPANKQNMIAWLAARSDAPNYGQMLLYKFPKERLVYGPSQIDARIDQDPEISPQLTLWGQAGSQVIRGNLLVIPINGSILYVEPLYLQSTQTKLPELRRVVVAYGNRVVMEDTLERGLTRIFGTAAAPETPGGAAETPPTDQTLQQLAQRAAALYREAQQRLQAGDWAGYGQAVKELGNVLTQLENRSRGQ